MVVLQGVRFKANPLRDQKLILSQWMGCARFIWNAKCDENRYFSSFARKCCPVGTYAPVDTKAAHFKSDELSPWLKDCPSQIIRNSATNWFKTYQKFMKGVCGKPKRKRKSDQGSIYLTRELFRFDVCADGVTRLFIGTKTNNIGYLSFKAHRKFKVPKSLYIKKKAGQYTVSFCYENEKPETPSEQEHFDYLKGASKAWLQEYVMGVDRGVSIPVHTGDVAYDFSPQQKKTTAASERYNKRMQKRMARQQQGSNRRNKTKLRIAKRHTKVSNIRDDFAHKTSRSIVNSKAKVIIFEALKTSDMTRKAKPKQDINGKFISNKAKQKSGLNKSILNVGWHQIETFTRYKANRAGKSVFKVPAPFTSQECAECGHTHPGNRQSQDRFKCVACGHVDNADRNAARVIKKHSIILFLDSGTELLGKGIPLLSKGRGANRKPDKSLLLLADGNESSKKKRTAATKVAA